MQDAADAITDDVRPDTEAPMDELQESIEADVQVALSEREPDIPVHPLAASFPMMEGEDLEALVEDIRANGQREPIELDASGQLIDGRNRLRACKLAGIAPTFVTREFDDPVVYILSRNLHRRHLTKSQCAMAYAQAYPEPPSAKERGQQGGRGREKTSTTELGSYSPELVRQARFILHHSSELAGKVMAGSSLKEAYDHAVQERREQEEYAQLRRDAGDRLDAISDVCSRLKMNIDRAAFVDQGDFLKQVRLDAEEIIDLAKQLANI